MIGSRASTTITVGCCAMFVGAFVGLWWDHGFAAALAFAIVVGLELAILAAASGLADRLEPPQ